MTRLPIRPRSINNAVRAPASGGGTMLMQIASWAPEKLTTVRGGTVRVPVGMLPKLRVPHPAWMLASWVAEKVLKELYTHAMLHLNGLSFVKFCALVGSDRFITAPPGNSLNCLTNQAQAGYSIGEIPAIVPTMSPGHFVRIMGISGVSSIGSPRYSVQSDYVVVGGAAMPRPFYAPAPLYAGRTRPAIDARFARPGHVPVDVRPWPVWAGPKPWTDPVPAPHAPDVPQSAGTAPPWSWAWVGSGVPVSRALPVNPAVPRAVPIGRTTEVKFGASTAAGRLFFALMRAREAVSEMGDFIQVVFRALPKGVQDRYGGSRASLAQQSAAIVKHAGDIDGGLFLRNLIANQIEDEIIGRTWFRMRADIRNAVFGNSMGSLGPVSNPAFQAYARAVAAFADAVAGALTGGPTMSHDGERTLRAADQRVKREWRRLTNWAERATPVSANRQETTK